MKRREFISLLGGAAAAWPAAARGQQPERMRRIGVLMNLAADDPESPVRVAAFAQGLQELGWSVGRNVRIDYRWAGGDVERFRKHALELVSIAPDVILAVTSPAVEGLQQATRSIPIVFASVTDPVGGGFVASLARPGGNATGFSLFEYGTAAKWVELLKQVLPSISRAAVLRNPAAIAGTGQLAAIQVAAASLGLELSPIANRDVAEMEASLSAFARERNGGLIVTASGMALLHRDMIISIAARHRMPAIYSDRIFVMSGGLMSYGPDRIDQLRRAASYVDRILKGEKPADLPVQQAVRFELVINLKTAKALDLTVPPMLIARADEVIE